MVGVARSTKPSGIIKLNQTTAYSNFSELYLGKQFFIGIGEPIQVETEQLSPARRTFVRRIFHIFKVVESHEPALAGISICDTPRLMPYGFERDRRTNTSRSRSSRIKDAQV